LPWPQTRRARGEGGGGGLWYRNEEGALKSFTPSQAQIGPAVIIGKAEKAIAKELDCDKIHLKRPQFQVPKAARPCRPQTQSILLQRKRGLSNDVANHYTSTAESQAGIGEKISRLTQKVFAVNFCI